MLPQARARVSTVLQPRSGAVMEAPWYRIARELIGTKEVPGSRANPRILELFRLAGFPDATRNKGDETAWCAAFVGACLRLSGYVNKGTLLASGYLHFGQDLGRDRVEGCIVVTKPLVTGASGHVAFYAGETNGKVILLGGNQHNVVNETKYPKDIVLTYRWPFEKSSIATSDLIKNIALLDPGLASAEAAVATQTGASAAFDTFVTLRE